MDTRRPQARIPDAIVVVNGLGVCVDCNNAFAQFCQIPAGMLVGQPLAGVAPALASQLEKVAVGTSDKVAGFGDQSFTLDVQPFTGGRDTDDRIVRLRGLSWTEVA